MRAGFKLGLILSLVFLAGAIFSIQKKQAWSCGFNAHNDWVCPGATPPFPTDPFGTGANTPTTTNNNAPVWSAGGVFNPGGGGAGGGSPPPGTIPPTSTPLSCGGGGANAYDEYLEHLKQREGVVNCVYNDSLGKPTVGVGHLVLPSDGLSVGDCISDAQVDAFLQADAANAWSSAENQALEMEAAFADRMAAVRAEYPCGSGVPPPTIDYSCTTVALGSVNYQLGTAWNTAKFPDTWDHIVNGRYDQANSNLESSLWNSQTPVRVDDFQAALNEQKALEEQAEADYRAALAGASCGP